jgi:hypothetical protein
MNKQLVLEAAQFDLDPAETDGVRRGVDRERADRQDRIVDSVLGAS